MDLSEMTIIYSHRLIRIAVSGPKWRVKHARRPPLPTDDKNMLLIQFHFTAMSTLSQAYNDIDMEKRAATIN